MQLQEKSSRRIESIDVLRGIVIVIMGLDHVRDFVAITPFMPEDVTQTSPAWFFTRWITHFCAPTFVFLAGISAFLYGQRVSKNELRRFLVTRGLWLVFIDVVVMHLVIFFDLFSFLHFQVIWVIGLSLLALALFTYFSRGVMIAFTLIVIAGHNLLDSIHIEATWWYFLHEQNWGASIGQLPALIIYPLIPWPAVMMAGYLIGSYYQQEEQIRNKRLIIVGGGAIIVFVALRLINNYGDAHHWSYSDRGMIYTFLDFLNTSKYPPSLLFLLMTLGPSILLLSFLEKADSTKSKIVSFFITFGKVPFFFYIIHFLLAHIMGLVMNGVVHKDWRDFVFEDPRTWPSTYQPSLVVAYTFWAALIVIMYFLCRWFAGVKKRRTEWWLKYL